MITTTKIEVLVFAVLAIGGSAFADDATQTDWSGGDGVLGPVTDWEDTFDTSTDISCLSFPGELYLSLTPLTSPVEHTVIDDFIGAKCVYAADIDDDGNMDILGAADGVAEITWWENENGSGTSWTKHILDTNFAGAYSVYAEDINGDDDIDIMGAASSDCEITWWENNGSSSGWNMHIVTNTLDGAISVYAQDINGDDDMDILGAAMGDDDIIWWENMDGSGTSWTPHIVDNDFDFACSVYATDIDGDDDMDILGAAFLDDTIRWWENDDGSGTSWTPHTISGGFDGAHCVYAEDIDGDDDIDVLGAAYFADNITWWENTDGSGTSWTPHVVDGSFDGAYSVFAKDMNGDSTMDIVGAAISGDDIYWWGNDDGSGTSWTEHIVDSDFNAISAFAEDVNGDGSPDVLGAADNTINWWDVVEFASSGDLTSSIYDIDSMDLEWGPISWTDGVPADTTVTVEVRASNDSGSMGSWVAVTSSGDDLTNYVDDNTRYFQYCVSLATTDTDFSPTFEDITINWNPLGIDGDEGNLPTTFVLHSAVPNPSDGSATIGFALPETCEVELALYDIKGRKVATLATGSHQPGEYSADVSGLSSGIYIYELNADEFCDTKKMVVK